MAAAIGWAAALAGAAIRSRRSGADAGMVPRARWSLGRAAGWSARTPWLMGCNFTPSTASNQLEMWQPETFDPTTIDRELGWAAALGMNSVRVFLHDLAWARDGDAFLDRVDHVLGLAAGHGVSVMPVLFDGIWDPRPRLGPQPEPRPGVHNSRWLQSPGAEVIAHPARWSELRGYVDAVMTRFARDPRVIVWDLFNEPDSPNPAYRRHDPPRKATAVGRLLEQIWDWAVEVDPDQPLTVGVYLFVEHNTAATTPVARVALERSDVVSFHCYAECAGLDRAIDRLAVIGRPLICTEWMARPDSPVELIGRFVERDVGAYCWGLVDGRTQTRFPWTSWVRRPSPGRPWFHDLLHHDGRPYDEAEAECLRDARRLAEVSRSARRRDA